MSASLADWPTPWQDVTLRLVGGLSVDGTDADIELRLQYLPDKETWAGLVWGYSLFFDQFGQYHRSLNAADFEGRLFKAALEDGRTRLMAEVDLMKDRYGVGFAGKASYDLSITLADERWSGTFAGKVLGKEVRGTVRGELGPVWPTPVKGYAPLLQQEHPRLMFRAGDLERGARPDA